MVMYRKFFAVGLSVGARGRDEYRNMKLSDFVVKEIQGRPVVCVYRDRDSKTHKGDLGSKPPVSSIVTILYMLLGYHSYYSFCHVAGICSGGEEHPCAHLGFV